MKVHLRQRRQKNGMISLYLEIYKGYLKTENKTKAIRDYEYVKIIKGSLFTYKFL